LTLGQYEAVFREHEIDAGLVEADLEKIGVPLGHASVSSRQSPLSGPAKLPPSRRAARLHRCLGPPSAVRSQSCSATSSGHILTPSPIRSPSASSTTSLRCRPIRTLYCAQPAPALRSIAPCWSSIAQRTASTTLRNSARSPSPVRLTTRPLWTSMAGSIKSLRNAQRGECKHAVAHSQRNGDRGRHQAAENLIGRQQQFHRDVVCPGFQMNPEMARIVTTLGSPGSPNSVARR
jgi:hypothetical protein